MRWVASLVCASLVGLAARRSAACDFSPPPPHVLDTSEVGVDTAAPSTIGETTYSVTRGRGPERSGCGETASSCDDIGRIQLYVSDVSDDRTSVEKLGYRVEVVAGSLPGFAPPTTAVGAFNGNQLFFHWIDDADDEQESIDVTFRIRAVDLAGNEGPPRDVRVRDDGRSEGCRIATSSVDVSLPVFGAISALFWALSRRKTWTAKATSRGHSPRAAR
jgi:hypothetical protein